MIVHRSALFLLLVSALLTSCAVEKPAASPVATGGGAGIYKVGLPYKIDGIWYYPGTNYAYDETGVASWYGKEFRGKLTANGEIFDPDSLTAAHPTLPMPSIVQVTNLENGRSLNLRVNDRGPYGSGSIIAVSRGVARVLGFEAQGNAKVRVRILVLESVQAALLAMPTAATRCLPASERRRRERCGRQPRPQRQCRHRHLNRWPRRRARAPEFQRSRDRSTYRPPPSPGRTMQ